MKKNVRDNRKWLKVYPRNFNNEYYFLGFDDKKVMDKLDSIINNYPNKSCIPALKREVEDVEKFEEITGFTGLKGIYAIYGSEQELELFVNEL